MSGACWRRGPAVECGAGRARRAGRRAQHLRAAAQGRGALRRCRRSGEARGGKHELVRRDRQPACRPRRLIPTSRRFCFTGGAAVALGLRRRLAERPGPDRSRPCRALSAGAAARRGLAERQHGRGGRQCQPDVDRVRRCGRERAEPRARRGRSGRGRRLLEVAEEIAAQFGRMLYTLLFALVVRKGAAEILRAAGDDQVGPLEVPAGAAPGTGQAPAGRWDETAACRPRRARPSSAGAPWTKRRAAGRSDILRLSPPKRVPRNVQGLSRRNNCFRPAREPR